MANAVRGSDGYASTSSPTFVPGFSVPSMIRNPRDICDPLTRTDPNICPYPPRHATPQICLVLVFAVDGRVIRPSATAYVRRFSTMRGWIGSRSLFEKYQPTPTTSATAIRKSAAATVRSLRDGLHKRRRSPALNVCSASDRDHKGLRRLALFLLSCPQEVKQRQCSSTLTTMSSSSSFSI